MVRLTINIWKIGRYLKRSPGVPFIVGFQVLLLWHAFLLSMGYSGIRDWLLMYAYYLMVMGVVLQLIASLREGKQKLENEQHQSPSTPSC